MSTSETVAIANRYRLVRPVGQGGMSRVWLARDEVLGRDVALKELVTPPGVSHDEELDMRRRAVREARALARLNNPNVVKIFDIIRVGTDDPWIVMEYVTGRSVQEALNRDGSMSPVRAAAIGYDTLNALRAAHAAGVVHRDVKPGNVLLSDDGRVLLTDFGLATAPDDPRVTRAGEVLGSPSYMAPERANDGVTGPEADLWSLGAMLYRMVEGHPPFERSSIMATLTALATEPVPPPRHAGDLEQLIIGLLEKDPAARLSEVRAASMLRAVASGAVAESHESTGAEEPRDLARGVAAKVAPVARTEAPASQVGSLKDAPPDALRSRTARPPNASPLHVPMQPPDASLPASSPHVRSRSGADDGPVPVDAPGRPGVPVRPKRPRESLAWRERSRPWRRVVIIGALVAVAGMIVLLAVVVPSGGKGRRPSIGYGPGTNSAGASVTPTGPSAQSSVPALPSPTNVPGNRSSAGAGGSSFTLPAGWQMRSDGTGFSVPVPDGWQFGRDPDGRPLWRDPGHAQLLLIDQSRHPKPDPVQDWLNNEAARRSGYDNYVRIKIVAVDYWDKAADWEFTYTRDGHPLHVLNRGFITAPDQAYSIYWSTPASQWTRDLSQLEVILRGFRPARQ